MNLVVKEIRLRRSFWFHDDRKWCWAESCVLQFICLLPFFFDPQKCFNIDPWSKHKSYCRALTCCMFCPCRSIHSSESQQEFFRMLDEKIEKVRNDSPSAEHRLVFLQKKLQLNDIMEVNPVTAANVCQARTQQMTTWYLKTASICHARPTSEVI